MCNLRGVTRPYNDTHKIIDNVLYKLCSDCNKWLLISKDFYKNKSAPDGHNPYCKECAKKRTSQWKGENRDKVRKWDTDYLKNTNRQQYHREQSKTQRENGYYKQWQQEHPCKVKGYNKDRKMNKEHDITDEEWYACLDYFNNSCAYCGLSEEMQYDLYNEQFHMEHVDHNGSNYIDNCVPACTSCNTSKFTFEFNDWYNESNELFSKRRLNKIIKWMTEGCFNVLNLR